MKKCNTCKRELLLSDFGKNRSRKDGLTDQCRNCRNEYTKEYNKKYPERCSQRRKQHRQKNSVKIKAGIKSWRERHPEKSRQYNAKYRVHNKDKIATRRRTLALEKSGVLIRPDRCSQCGVRSKIVAHHPDYSKPELVMWLCLDCHGLEHRTIPEAG